MLILYGGYRLYYSYVASVSLLWLTQSYQQRGKDILIIIKLHEKIQMVSDSKGKSCFIRYASKSTSSKRINFYSQHQSLFKCETFPSSVFSICIFKMRILMGGGVETHLLQFIGLHSFRCVWPFCCTNLPVYFRLVSINNINTFLPTILVYLW